MQCNHAIQYNAIEDAEMVRCRTRKDFKILLEEPGDITIKMRICGVPFIPQEYSDDYNAWHAGVSHTPDRNPQRFRIYLLTVRQI
jgi:hypothetical protein